MKQLSLSRMVAVACILCASSVGASAAQSKHGNDPARWYNGDSTQAQRMQVLKKELNAAYAEQTAACKKHKSGQSACLKEARANFQRDSANARELVANAPQSEITERVVSTTPAGGEQTTQSGSSAYGGTGATGQTGAGNSQAMPGAGTPPVQSTTPAGSNNTQSMGAGTGATQSDTQDQPRAGAVPPVQR